MVIGSQIQFPVGQDVSPQRDPEALRALEESLTYDNPKFQDAARLGFSTYNTPAKVCLAKQLPGNWYIPRGLVRTVLKHFPHEPIREQVIFHRETSALYFNEDFVLDERQMRCLDAVGSQRKQGIIHAATSAGKSAIIMAMIAKIKQPTLVIVNRAVLLEQLLRDAEETLAGVTIGVLDGTRKEIGEVTFGIDKTILNMLRAEDNNWQKPFTHAFGCIIMDEVHQAACPTVNSIMGRLPAMYRYGLSGTLKRKDRMDFMIHAHFGEVIATITQDEIIDAGRATPYSVVVAESPATLAEAPEEETAVQFWKRADTELHESKEREDFLFEYVLDLLKKGKTPAVGFRFIEPAKRLHKRLSEHFPMSLLLGGVKDPKGVCDEVQDGKTAGIIATYGCFSTGVNIKRLTDLVIASPIYSNPLMLHQLRGRILRTHEGKAHAYVHFIADPLVFPNHKLRRVVRILES